MKSYRKIVACYNYCNFTLFFSIFRPSTVCVKLEPWPVYGVSVLKRPRRLRPMICRNLPRSKAALVVINPYKQNYFYLALRILQPIPKSRILKFHKLSVNQIALIRRQTTKNWIIPWKPPILNSESMPFFLHCQNWQSTNIFLFQKYCSP